MYNLLINNLLTAGIHHGGFVQLNLASKTADNLVNWLLDKLKIIFTVMDATAAPGDEILGRIGGFMRTFGLLMFGIGVVLAIVEELARYQQGSGNMGRLCINVLKAAAFNIVVFQIFPRFFKWAVSSAVGGMLNSGLLIGRVPTSKLGEAVTGTCGAVAVAAGAAATSITAGAGLGSAFAIVILIIMIIFVKAVFSFLFDMAGKYILAVCMEGEGGLLAFQIARGNDSIAESYIQKVLMLILSMLIEGFVFGAGISLIANGGNAGTAEGFKAAIGYWIMGAALVRFAPSITGIMGAASAAPRPSTIAPTIGAAMGAAGGIGARTAITTEIQQSTQQLVDMVSKAGGMS